MDETMGNGKVWNSDRWLGVYVARAQMQDRGLWLDDLCWLLWLGRRKYSTQTVSGKFWLLIVVY